MSLQALHAEKSGLEALPEELQLPCCQMLRWGPDLGWAWPCMGTPACLAPQTACLCWCHAVCMFSPANAATDQPLVCSIDWRVLLASHHVLPRLPALQQASRGRNDRPSAWDKKSSLAVCKAEPVLPKEVALHTGWICCGSCLPHPAKHCRGILHRQLLTFYPAALADHHKAVSICAPRR